MERRAFMWGAALGLAVVGLVVLTLALGIFARASTGPRLSLKLEAYDFGRISPSQQVVKEIEFTNTGAQVLVIKDVLPVPPPEGG